MTKLYHASSVSGIQTLKAVSSLHGEPGSKVVYLTESLPYSLFYIWDAEHNKKPGKHVTCWLKDGIVYYEEQFPDQLRSFYEGVKGYVYSVHLTDQCEPMPGRESMWFSRSDTEVEASIFIKDVYSEIMRYAQLGQIKVIPFSEVSPEKIRMLHVYMAQQILSNGWLNHPECPDAVFYRSYFPGVWEAAANG